MKAITNSEAALLIPHKAPTKAQTILACGRRESGKSYLIREYLKTCEPRVLFIDAFDDFEGSASTYADVDAALTALRTTIDNPWTACRARVRPPVGVDTHEWGDYLFSCLVNTDEPWNIILALDEITRYSDLHERTMFRQLTLAGRHVGVRTISGCQRMALVPISIQSELTDLVIFKQSRPRDVNAIREWTDNEIAEASRKLLFRQCIYVEI